MAEAVAETARGNDGLLRGLRALEEVGPAKGEPRDQWAQRIGGGCGWGEDRGAPLAAELTRITRVWVERQYILKNNPPRITVAHCRAVIAAWKHAFATVIAWMMPDGWLSSVGAFDNMYSAAKKSDRDHKESQDKSLLCRLDASLCYADAVRLAEECLELAAAATSAADRYKWVQQWQYLCFALIGPRAQLMLVSQDYNHTTYRSQFGSGDAYAASLFKHAAYKRQPACLSLHHLSKNDQSHAPLNLIPARVTTVCPLFATRMSFSMARRGATLPLPAGKTGSRARSPGLLWPVP